jgi:S-adenosylmethionine:tRNA ribosyltransferase-isomerase
MLAIDDFIYDLPDERIAKYPLPERDSAKLLVWKDGHIDHKVFKQLPDLLTGREILFFNNTKVIPARLYFRKPSGGLIEVFLLEPSAPHLVELAMRATQSVVYQCTIGNLKRWAEGTTLSRTLDLDNGQQCNIGVTLVDKAAMTVRFEWDMPQLPFARIVEMAGVVP